MPQHKRSIFDGLIASGLAACHIVSPPHLPAATPSATPDVADYYGRPTPATLLIDGQSQAAGIGTSTWVASKSGDQGVTVHGDAFGIVTPREPLIVSSPFSATLQLPIPITPTELACSVLPVSASEQRAPAAGATAIWNVYYQPNRSQPWDAGQAVTLTLQPGTYVLAVSATWAELGRVEYGFLLMVASTIPAEPPANFAFTWHDASLEPSTGKAEQLRHLFQLIGDIVKEQPEVQQLPPRPIGCA